MSRRGDQGKGRRPGPGRPQRPTPPKGAASSPRGKGSRPGARAAPAPDLPRWLRQALQRAGIEPRLALGQSFLHDKQILDREVAYAELEADHTVLEIGPGVGNLTGRLASRCGRLVAIEKDQQFAPLLEPLVRQHGNIELIWGDALTVPLPACDRAVANLPYKLALPLVFRLLEQRFGRAVLCLQRSLATRLSAAVGEPGYGRLSVAVGRRARAEVLEVVPAHAFHPRPAVDSAVVLLHRTPPTFSVPDEAFFRKLLEGLFARRNCTLAEALNQMAAAAPDGVVAAKAAPGGTHRAALQRGRVDRRLLDKLVYRVTPKEFGAVAWAVWDSR